MLTKQKEQDASFFHYALVRPFGANGSRKSSNQSIGPCLKIRPPGLSWQTRWSKSSTKIYFSVEKYELA